MNIPTDHLGITDHGALMGHQRSTGPGVTPPASAVLPGVQGVPGGVTALQWHPHRAELLLAGCATGGVALFDRSTGSSGAPCKSHPMMRPSRDTARSATPGSEAAKLLCPILLHTVD